MYQSIRPLLTVFPVGYPCVLNDNDTFANINPIGMPGPQGPAGPAGPQGISITSAYVTENPGDLILVLSNGTEINAGRVVGPQGPQGEQGPQGPQGPAATPGDCETVLVSENYECTIDNCYIGVNSSGPVTITLPPFAPDGNQIAIKAEMGPPLGNRKITIVSSDGRTIDGDDDYVMTVPYECVHLLCRGGNWNII